MKILEENTGGKVCDISCWWLFELIPNIKARKKNKMTTSNIKLIYSEQNHQENENATYRMGENICKSYIL